LDLLKPLKKLRLESFNNLTKTLSFNIYDVCYAHSAAAQHEYLSYIDEVYNAEQEALQAHDETVDFRLINTSEVAELDLVLPLDSVELFRRDA